MIRPSTPAAPIEVPAGEFEFVFRSARLCLSFVATVGERWRGTYERLRHPGDLARWYHEVGLLGQDQHVGVTAVGLERAKAVREAVYRCAKSRIAGLPAAEADEAVLNAAAETAPLIPALRGGISRLALPGTGGEYAALSAVARDAIELLGGEQAGRIRECAHPECALLFVDTSRPGRRQWCSSTACGGKTRSAEYRRRKASEPSAN